jgi:hypothetical protein
VTGPDNPLTIAFLSPFILTPWFYLDLRTRCLSIMIRSRLPRRDSIDESFQGFEYERDIPARDLIVY